MFNATQTRLMNILGIVSDTDRYNTYEAYCEMACEMSAEGMNCGTFADYLERKVLIAEYTARRNNQQALQGA